MIRLGDGRWLSPVLLLFRTRRRIFQVDERLESKSTGDADTDQRQEGKRRHGLLESMCQVDTEDGTEGGQREKEGCEQIQAVCRASHLVSRGCLGFGLQCGGEAQRVLSIQVSEIGHSFNLVGTVAIDDQLLGFREHVAGMLQRRV